MYESPIKQYLSEIQTEMESALLYTVKQKIGYGVDKAELIKALKYDREQYEKGYSDGLNADNWISCKDKMPDDGVNVLIYAGNRMISLAWYDKNMGYFYICDSDYKYNSLDVTHWQPLPEMPREEAQR